jgi:hypothetical protein
MGTFNGSVDVCCHGTSAVIEFEWFVYGAMFGFVAPYAWPFIRTCIEEFQIARRDWRKRD